MLKHKNSTRSLSSPERKTFMCVGACVGVGVWVWKAAHRAIECAHYGPGQSGSPPSAPLNPRTQWPHSSACPTSLLMTATRHSGKEWTIALHSSLPCHQLLMSHFCSVRRNDTIPPWHLSGGPCENITNRDKQLSNESSFILATLEDSEVQFQFWVCNFLGGTILFFCRCNRQNLQ